VHPLVLELTGKKTPRDGLEGKFSVYHGAACGLLYGKATPAEYTDKVVEATAELRAKITATVEEGVRSDEARIVVNDGEHELHVQHAVGSLEVPMTDSQLEEKFMDNVVPALGAEKAAKISNALWDIKTTEYCPWKVSE
jgi:aconitate decarboxylase